MNGKHKDKGMAAAKRAGAKVRAEKRAAAEKRREKPARKA